MRRWPRGTRGGRPAGECKQGCCTAVPAQLLLPCALVDLPGGFGVSTPIPRPGAFHVPAYSLPPSVITPGALAGAPMSLALLGWEGTVGNGRTPLAPATQVPLHQLRVCAPAPHLHGLRLPATGIVYNITGGPDLTLSEVNRVSEVVTSLADPTCNIIFGAGEPRATQLLLAQGGMGGMHTTPAHTRPLRAVCARCSGISVDVPVTCMLLPTSACVAVLCSRGRAVQRGDPRHHHRNGLCAHV